MPTREFFVVANSNAAPICSDQSTSFITAWTALEAVEKARRNYTHPAGLYALAVYESADAFHKGEKPLAQHLSRRADMRTNGVECQHCGHKTYLVVANKGVMDIHHCSHCKENTEVDMSHV